MSSHDTDVVGFFFGLVCLVSAVVAVAIRTGSLGMADGRQGIAWTAAAVLLGAGALGVVGTIGARRRSARPDQPPKT